MERRQVALTIAVWLEHARRDAERRGLTALAPMLDALARATSALRAADWNENAAGRDGHVHTDVR